MKSDLFESAGFPEVPLSWERVRLRFAFRLVSRAYRSSHDLLSVYLNRGVIPYAEGGGLVHKPSEDLSGYQFVQRHDLVLNNQQAWRGSVGVSSFNGNVSPAYVVLEPQGSWDSRYLNYLSRSQFVVNQLEAASRGVGDIQRQVNIPLLKNVVFPKPPTELQKSIAKFLDRETLQIDALIEKQQQLIQTLEERRLSLISRAVTYGLESVHCYQTTNSITWPEVPTNWKIIALKHVLQIPMTDGPHETPEFLDEGVEFISAEAVSQGVINFDKRRGYISEGDHARYSRKYFPRLHDIYVIKSGATTGRSAILTEERDFNIWSPLAVVRASNEIDPFFLHFVIQSEPFQKSIELSWSFGTQQNIGMGVLQNLQIPLPPYDEQIQIRDHLLFEISNIDSLIEKSKSMIDVILERRQALISAAVTGKIDVRGK